MNILEELYARKKEVEQQKINSMASSMLRRQKLNRIQREIDYYEQGDEISRNAVQQQLAEIDKLQKQIDQLAVDLANKKTTLLNDVFGEGASLL